MRQTLSKSSGLSHEWKETDGPLTIGIDLGDRYSQCCVLGAQGDIIAEGKLASTQNAFEKYFKDVKRVRIAIEAWQLQLAIVADSMCPLPARSLRQGLRSPPLGSTVGGARRQECKEEGHCCSREENGCAPAQAMGHRRKIRTFSTITAFQSCRVNRFLFSSATNKVVFR
jgi:hypothetical protein